MSASSKRGRSAPRSRNGCWTCRERKVKCDEATPSCQRCTRAGRECTYSVPQGKLKRFPRPAASASPASDPPLTTNELDTPEDDNRIMRFYKEQYLSFLTTKSPEWSFIAGIVYLGRTSSAVMNFIMANVQIQASVIEHSDQDRYQALEHYQTGLRDFATLVGSGEYDPLTLLGTLFLLVQFELRHAEQAEDIDRHLHGFGSAVLVHGSQLIPGLTTSTTPGITSDSRADNEELPIQIRYQNVLNRLGLWMTYMDAISSTWDLGGSVMHTFMIHYPGSIDAIFAKSRQAGQEIWGEDYPTSEALDDLQNRPAFDLYHKAHILRYRVTCYRRSLTNSTEKDNYDANGQLSAEITAMIESLMDEYNVLLDIASQWLEPTTTVSRIKLNLHFIVPFFFASIVEFDSLLSERGQTSPSRALAGILKIATIVHETEPPQSMCRLAWPLFIAGVETLDFVYQNWILQRFAALRDFGISYSRAHEVLKEVTAHQRLTSKRADYREWIKHREDFPAFII